MFSLCDCYYCFLFDLILFIFIFTHLLVLYYWDSCCFCFACYDNSNSIELIDLQCSLSGFSLGWRDHSYYDTISETFILSFSAFPCFTCFVVFLWCGEPEFVCTSIIIIILSFTTQLSILLGWLQRLSQEIRLRKLNSKYMEY